MTSTHRSLFTVLVTVTTMAATTPANADWPANGLFINAIDPGFSPLNYVPDGAGGVIMSWPLPGKLLLQRISPDGELLFGPVGKELTGLNNYSNPIPDGSGGFLITAVDAMQKLHLLRTDSAVNVVLDKMVIGTTFPKVGVKVAGDGMGGFLLAWSEDRTASELDLYVQRTDANGDALWTPDGVHLRSAAMSVPHGNTANVPVYTGGVKPVGDGGALVTSVAQQEWQAIHDPTVVQTVSSGGVLLGSLTLNDPTPARLEDGTGALYTVLKSDGGLRLRRTLPGAESPAFDVAITPSLFANYQSMSLEAGGVLVAWGEYDYLNFEQTIRAQKVSDTGTVLWGETGVLIASIVGQRGPAKIGTDYYGGAYIFWPDARYAPNDIYWQHLDAAGEPEFYEFGTIEDGEFFAGRSDYDDTKVELYTDPAGHGIVMWYGGDGTYAKRYSTSTVAVAISRFKASARDEGVVLEADLRSDLDIHDVKIYRATDNGALRLLAHGLAPDGDSFRYVDTQVLPGTGYRYQLAVTDNDGEFLSPIVDLTTPALTTELKQNHPNPFNPETTIGFALENAARTTIDIYGIDGRHVRTLLDERRGVGFHHVTWDGTDDRGNPVGSGIYLYRLSADKFHATRKMLLLK